MLIWFPFNKNCKPPWDDRWYVRYIKIHIIIIIIIIQHEFSHLGPSMNNVINFPAELKEETLQSRIW